MPDVKLFQRTIIKKKYIMVPRTKTNHNHLILDKNLKIYIGQCLQQMMPKVSDYQSVEKWSKVAITYAVENQFKMESKLNMTPKLWNC